jgi:hypothetical protein
VQDDETEVEGVPPGMGALGCQGLYWYFIALKIIATNTLLKSIG